MTRLNVYAGPAGFYIIRGGPAGDKAVLDSRTGTPAVLPGPAPEGGRQVPARTRRTTRSRSPSRIAPSTPTARSSTRTRARSSTAYDGPVHPGHRPLADLEPRVLRQHDHGQRQHLAVPDRRAAPLPLPLPQRLPVALPDPGLQRRSPGVEVWQIGNEGGFLAAPVNLTADHGNRLLMGLAERADVIVDFTNVPVGNYVLGNVGPDEPFGGGDPRHRTSPSADPATTGQVMQFRVGPGASPPTPPRRRSSCSCRRSRRCRAGAARARWRCIEMMSMRLRTTARRRRCSGVGRRRRRRPIAQDVDGRRSPRTRPSATPRSGSSTTPPPTPTRCTSTRWSSRWSTARPSSSTRTASPCSPSRLAGDAAAARSPGRRGFKDTVIAYPGQVTRVRAQFDNPGQFVWHCHIVEHEDNEMMRPFRIGPVQPGQPG